MYSGINITNENSHAMTSNVTTDTFNVVINTSDITTAEVIARRLATALTNLGDTAEITVTRTTNRVSQLDNSAF